jgi:hypothetical protein
MTKRERAIKWTDFKIIDHVGGGGGRETRNTEEQNEYAEVLSEEAEERSSILVLLKRKARVKGTVSRDGFGF